MKIERHGTYLELDFEKPGSAWALLVIDDYWDSVVEMVCGISDLITGETSPGLGPDSTSTQKVREYWETRGVGAEAFERTLLILPAVVHGAENYSKLVFTGFPRTSDDLASLPLQSKHTVAVLIDQFDAGTRRERLQETWGFLDIAGYPHHTRARFTRGGISLPSKFVDVEIIHKEPPRGGTDAHVQKFRAWLQRVRGAINVLHHAISAKAACHNPSELGYAPLATRQAVCEALLEDDSYGVWRWCSESVSQDPLPEDAPHRWLAGKAFNSWKDCCHAPLAAVIAICEGSRFLRVDGELKFKVDSGLWDIASERIDRVLALGQVTFKVGTYHDFAAALRDWLTAPEQFEPGNGQINEILITGGDKFGVVEMVYSAKLPDCIFDGGAQRVGRTRAAWLRLASFARSTAHNGKVVTLTFDFES